MSDLSSYSKKSFWIIAAIFFCLNLFYIGNLELSYDEAYYWIYSEFLSWGYFDHPPLVGVFIKLGTLIFGQTELGVRFFFNILFLLSLYLIWKMTGQRNKAVFWVSAFMMPLLNFSGILALPDTPMLFFATLFFFLLKRYLAADHFFNSLLLALAIAGMFYSKYHGLLIVLLTVCGNLAFLKRKSFYIVVLLVIVFFLPHMIWQYQHDFISFRFHLTGRSEKHFELSNILDFVAGQIALFGIFNFFIFLYLFYKHKFQSTFERILLMNSFGFLGFLFFLSFRNQIEANWTITVTVPLLILFTPLITGKTRKLYLGLAILPLALMMIIRVIMATPTSFVHYFDNPSDPDENRINEIIHWKDKKIPAVLTACQNQRIVADSYQIAAKLSFYLDQKIPALHLDSRESQYSILKLQQNIPPHERICFLTSEDDHSSVKIETYFKDPIFVIQNTSLEKLAQLYGLTYEKIIRNSK